MQSEIIQLYDDREDVTLTTYVIDPIRTSNVDLVRPAVIICPGGSYMYCSDREAEPVAMAFNAMGFNAFVLRYSVYGQGKTTAEIIAEGQFPVKPDVVFPHALKETARAFEILHQHASEWHIDTDKIGLAGFSAGGHNTGMYSNVWHTDLIQNATSLKGSDLKPAFNISGYALTDIAYYYRQNIANPDPNVKAYATAISLACFGKPMPSEEEVEQYSVPGTVNEKTPPTFIWGTRDDDVVNVRDSLSLAMALEEHEIPFAMHIFQAGPHGLSVANELSAVMPNQINETAAQWVPLVEKWLKELILK
ncbi:alpha/beta hydrolase [Aerococcus agrisoli]|uniref:Alpha/beta hydrolase n=1 Tax=Aerococcus agrisoli TaxID=2487350 RepID=A0A3N4GGR8_9LACT|nr:alpha/beta hydrolase [Aerococcus agrisoli]RPA59846.1 alpha/beta hydrolase [Aerococcus agrisoli]